MSKTFSQADVAAHNKPSDLYVTIDEDVYDLTAFQDEHPGTFPSPNPDLSIQGTKIGE
jgi:cytochrome b involved in lipid metabolism